MRALSLLLILLVAGCGGAVATTPAEPLGGSQFPRYVEGIDTADPERIAQVDKVLDALEHSGKPPRGVRQGGRGVFENREGKLPDRPDGWYTESDVWPGPGPRGTERVVRGRDGEAWYTPDHYGTFRRVR